MREILFRGMRLDNCNWIIGHLIKYEDGRARICESHTDIFCYEKDKSIIQTVAHMVAPSTIGQFTGLTDKNGKKIFEGDIVRVLGNQQVDDWKNVDYVALIAFLDGGFCAIDGTVEEHGFRRYALARMDFSLEIIGNQFDNPELLENP